CVMIGEIFIRTNAFRVAGSDQQPFAIRTVRLREIDVFTPLGKYRHFSCDHVEPVRSQPRNQRSETGCLPLDVFYTQALDNMAGHVWPYTFGFTVEVNIPVGNFAGNSDANRAFFENLVE